MIAYISSRLPCAFGGNYISMNPTLFFHYRLFTYQLQKLSSKLTSSRVSCLISPLSQITSSSFFSNPRQSLSHRSFRACNLYESKRISMLYIRLTWEKKDDDGFEIIRQTWWDSLQQSTFLIVFEDETCTHAQLCTVTTRLKYSEPSSNKWMKLLPRDWGFNVDCTKAIARLRLSFKIFQRNNL